jgi:hypothetical protein
VEFFGNANKDTAKNMFIRMCSTHTAKTKEEVRDLAMKFVEHIDLMGKGMSAEDDTAHHIL